MSAGIHNGLLRDSTGALVLRTAAQAVGTIHRRGEWLVDSEGALIVTG